MLARKKTSKHGKPLPQDWLESLARLLNETYKTECKQGGRYFDVYGQVYAEELLVVVSYLSEKDEYLTPISCFLSCEPDQMASESKVRDTQANFIEIIGLFFDEIFADNEWNQFEPHWQEVSHKHQNYFYKITRENINLTIEANRLLGTEFLEELEDTEEEDELEQ